MRRRLLAADIGNTRISFAFRRNGRWKERFSVSTHGREGELRRALGKRKRLLAGAEAVIASVVPAKTLKLRSELKRLGVRVAVIGKDIPVPIKNRYRDPRQVGVDRLLNALAAWRRYKRELIVIDFGTAVTFDVVSAKGEYLGGVIAPGIEISLEALFQKTALLPKTRLEHPKNWIGKDTIESIRVGCSVGIGGLCDGVVRAISERYHMRPYVLATGGYAPFIRRYCRSIQAVKQDLILEGILASIPDKLA